MGFVVDSLYPASCAACDQLLAAPEGLCTLCLESCSLIDTACPLCALPISGPCPIPCARCIQQPPPLDSSEAAFEYGGQVALALKRLKFGGRNDIAKTLRPLLQARFSRAAVRSDLALAIPLHPRRLRQRSFNQAQRLLLPLAKRCHLPVARDALRRIRNTSPQARLSAARRRSNLEGAFRAGRRVAGRRILLLDDVSTTGSTLNAAARALKQAGALEVHAFVVARAEWDGPG